MFAHLTHRSINLAHVAEIKWFKDKAILEFHFCYPPADQDSPGDQARAIVTGDDLQKLKATLGMTSWE